MAEVLLFHHAQGLTAGVSAFAARLRSGGHVVHTPDLYEGRTFTSLNEGVKFAKQVGFDEIRDRGRAAAERLPKKLVYAGFSLGVLPAQFLAQTRSGAAGALFISAAFPPSEFGGPWPPGVPVEIHMMESDPWVMEGDLAAAREIERSVEGARLFVYPGDRHLFADSSLADHDKEAAGLLLDRAQAFLGSVGRT